ncbi:cyclic nucleotide-binding domain-containing protein [Curvivirga aplysinae]|uniref:cyclic nucleotide-binding domain-containing protein n=1 Tax=Curvivirga aplysinae TaxID=2529852 RepID=UPI0012BBBED4|nr:cyclic nucleotide-binding domain-containing protein [Curvivirga aplysinae]MTI10404.1 cyclic nucleotide-binding domain-containing protein [Curvivirga aplysinae]
MKKVLYILGLLEDEDIDWMVTAGHREQYKPGDELVQENVQNGNLFIMAEGTVNVTIRGKKVAEITQGEVFGEMSLLDSRPPSATIVASTDILVLRIDFDDLEARLNSNPKFQGRFYKALGVFLAQRLRVLNLNVISGDSAYTEDEDEFIDDEIDEQVLEKITLAGTRFKVIIDKLKNG